VALTFSITQLATYTDDVLKEIAESGEPGLLTRHGRFIALIAPIDDATIMRAVLTSGPIADELQRRAAAGDPTYSTDEVLDMIHGEPS
jgi:antitoxin (DNA-binding transcriptional repressor) of toxin-antitoxin stability system